jgi:hypothetical protein
VREAVAGPGSALSPSMSTLTFKVNRKSGTYVRPSLVPANHSAQTRFGVVDAVISAFFLGCVGGLIYLLLQI